MSRVDGVGQVPPTGDRPPGRKQGKKKSKDAPKFDEVLKKKGKGKGEGEGKGGAVNGKGGGADRGRKAQGGKGKAPGGTATGTEGVGKGKKEAVKFTIKDEAVRGQEKLAATYRRETVKQKKMADQNTEAVGQSQQNFSIRHDAQQVQETKGSSLPPELVQKLVESVRIGQNRVGATEMRLGLKSTVFEGMNLKVSTKDGIVQVVMQVEQYAAKEKLEGEIAQLQDRLEAQGLSVGEITVEVKGESSSGAFGAMPGGAGEGAGEGGRGEGGEPRGVERGGGTEAAKSRSGTERDDRKPGSSTDYTI